MLSVDPLLYTKIVRVLRSFFKVRLRAFKIFKNFQNSQLKITFLGIPLRYRKLEE